jgi:hypothetical protein
MRPLYPRVRSALWLMALAVAGASAPAVADSKRAGSDARAVFEREVATCNARPPGAERANCLREAHAAHDAARRGDPATPPAGGDAAQTAANALKRCEALPESHRKDCVARMQGQGTTRGSVGEGGIYRELVTPVPAPAPAADPPAVDGPTPKPVVPAK